MVKNGFLDKLARHLLQQYSLNLTDTVVILPNKRARVFLLEALRLRTDKNILAPTIVSVEDFVQDIAGIRSMDSIEVLFEFYEVYLSLTPELQRQPFEQFANWAKVLLQDFNEIDRYLLDPAYVLSYLKDIEDIKKWGIEVEDRTTLLENYIDFWKLLPVYYQTLYDRLINKESAYQGIIYREAVNNLDHFAAAIGDTRYVFAGFNALNNAEEKIVQHLLSIGKAEIFWDIDRTLLQDPLHDAGLFLRKFRESWKHYRFHDFNWISDEFAQPKNIQVIGTPKSIGQAKIAGSIVEEILVNDGGGMDATAVVLADENLLLPLLYSLPAATGPLNITMGYAAKSSPAQTLIAKLFRLHVNAAARSGYAFYYKEILDVLTHPLIEPYVGSSQLVATINTNNYTFISHTTLQLLQQHPNPFFELLFGKWEANPLGILDTLTTVILTVRQHLNRESNSDRIAETFIHAIYKVLNKLTSYCEKYHHITNPETLFSLYKQAVELAEVSFEGEPLQGLQVMGVLETRVLDFENVIITSMNEGSFPAGKASNSFIPLDLKREMGLPTYKEKDAIYTYHFYHLLQRAKNIYLIYNSSGEGFDAGEKSRFITQLEVEPMPSHQITFETRTASLPEQAILPVVIPKSEAVMERLGELAQSGFSPSSLTMYIRNPLEFYFKKILRIRESEEVEENIAMNTLGTIIHETLFALYTPFIGRLLTERDIQDCYGRLEDEVLKQFKIVYKEGDIRKGRNLLAFEVAKRNVSNFLRTEMELLKDGSVVQIIALEQTYERILEDTLLPYPVKIAGNVDRIEIRDDKLRIIDYKTGKVEKKDVSLKAWELLTTDVKHDKIIQLLAYAFMYAPQVTQSEVEVGIISFKNLRSGFMPFCFTEGKEKFTTVTPDIAESYKVQLVGLIREILDPDIPFTEKI